MTRLHAFVLLLGIVGIILAGAFFWPVAAQERACKSISDIEAEIEAVGGIISGAATYRGAETDTLLVVETADVIMLYGFKDGCYVGAMLVEAAQQRTGA